MKRRNFVKQSLVMPIAATASVALLSGLINAHGDDATKTCTKNPCAADGDAYSCTYNGTSFTNKQCEWSCTPKGGVATITHSVC
jgi:hypothetical protein